MAYSIVESASRQLGTLLIAEAKYLYGVRDQVENLQRELIRMKFFLQDADNREYKEAHVRQWVAEIREIAYEAEDIIERYIHGVSHHQKRGIRNSLKWFCCLICDARTLHEVGSNIEGLRAWITELYTWAQSYGIRIISQSENSTHSAMLREKRRTYAPIEEDHVVGLKKVVTHLVDALSNNQYQVVGICGMGGLGKTTLAKMVYLSKTLKEKLTDTYVWVYVSEKFESRKVLEEIFKGLGGVNVGEMNESDLRAKICEELKRRKCLVVLDDIWTSDAWELLEPAFPSIESSESRILLTTRNVGVLASSDRNDGALRPNVKLHELQCLNGDDAWTLLQQKASFSRRNKGYMVEREMKELGRDMLKYCGGLPLAIVALGGVLASKNTVGEWKDVRNRITSYLTREVGEGSGRLSSVLELSFYELPFYLKPCFLYLGSFPEGYKISAERLYLLWEAEGIVSAATYDDVQNQGVSCLEIAETYLHELAKRSMVQVEEYLLNGRIKSCRLHDAMRDICLKKCKEVNYLSVMESGDLCNPPSCIVSSLVESKRIHRCAIHQRHSAQNPEGMQSFEDSFFHRHQSNACCLRSLLGFPFEVHGGKKNFPSKVIKNFSLLRVLDLEGCIMHNIPKAIGRLILLRYLSFKGLHFKKFPSRRKLPACICDIKYLETLVLESGDGDDDAADDDVMLLPNKFWKMERLKHLYLPKKFEIKGCEKLTIGSGDHQRSQMETLKNFDPKKCQREGLREMTNLRIFSFNEYYIWEKANDVWKDLLPLPLSCLKLRINATIINEVPRTLVDEVKAYISSLEIKGKINVDRHFPPGLLRLKLDGSEISAEGILELEKLRDLKELVLVNNAVRGEKISTSADGFPRLVTLQVENMDELKEWELLEREAFPNLRDLNAKECPNWNGWLKGGDLPKLRNISIILCGQNRHAPEGSTSSN